MSTDKDKPDYQYLTINRKDYVKRPFKKITKFSTQQQYKDPIAESFKNYLDVDQKEYPPLTEDGDIYLDNVKDVRKKVGQMYFATPLDHEAIYDSRLFNGKTGYQIDYCDIKADIRRRLLELADKEKSRQPEDLVIPLTTQRYDYRNPTDLSEDALQRPPVVKAANNLVQNEEINKILHVTTGDSEYNGVIGKLGEFIVVNQMHGRIDRYDI